MGYVRKGGQGGARKNSGRPKAVIEDDVRGAIRRALGDSDDLNKIWKKVISEAKAGSDRYTALLFSYYYGKPKDNEGQPTEMIIKVNRR
jgi:hypothetical protein